MNLKIIPLVIAILALSMSAVATAETDESNITIHSTKEEALKASGLDKYATKENELVISRAAATAEKVKKTVGSKIGGSWIEYDDQNKARLVVGVKGAIDASSRGVLELDSETTIVNVRASLEELEEIQDKVLTVFSQLAKGSEMLIYGAAIDEQKNAVIVRGEKDNLLLIRSHLLATGIDLEMIQLEEQDGPTTLTGDLRGGIRIASTNPTAGMYACTAGFNVIIDGIYPGMITAGHCQIVTGWSDVHFNLGGSPTGTVKGPYIGTYFANGWPDAMDAVLYGNVNWAHRSYPQIIGPGGSLSTVKPVIPLVLNSTVCTRGGTNGWRCGVQKALKSRQLISGRVFTFAEASFCGGGGDSGGPVVSSEYNALGTYSGVIGNYPNGTCGAVFGGGSKPNSIFQPLAPYLDKYINVKIWTN